MQHLKYIKYRQEQLEKKHAAELEAKKEASRVRWEARKQEGVAARKKLLLEQREGERLRQHIQKEKLAEQKWNKQLDTLLAQTEDLLQEDDKLEEIRIIIQNREPSLEKLDWASWLLSSPLNQKLAGLDYEHAMEMFKRDNLLAKRRHGTRSTSRTVSYALAFTGDTAASAAEDHVTTDFNPDDYNLNLGCTVSYWVRPDEIGNTRFAFGRKHSNSERFTFGINTGKAIFIGVGANRMRSSWATMGVDTSLLASDGNIKTDGTWYHFVVTYADRESTSEGGVARKVYLNGELAQEANINWSSTGGGTGGMMFGGRRLAGTGYNNAWACALSEVAIFNTAKDADWVENVYNTNAPRRPTARRKKLDLRDESGLVGYWKFNEGSGTTVKDYSGNGNHGTFADISGDTTAYPTWDSTPFSNS